MLKNFLIQIPVQKFFKFDNPTPFIIDAIGLQQCLYLGNDIIEVTQTPATAENKNLLPIRFSQNFDSSSSLGLKEKLRSLPELTPTLRIHGHI